jgi:hypothetical protein
VTKHACSRRPPLDESSAEHGVAFDGVLHAVRRRTLELTCAIGGVRYLAAWLEACELERLIERAAHAAAAIPEAAERADAMRRLNEVRAVAASMLALAPAPSPAAIRQARSTDWQADRSEWQREEQEWMAARAASNAVQLIVSTRRTTPHPATRPDSPRALRAATPGGGNEHRGAAIDEEGGDGPSSGESPPEHAEDA